MKRGNANRQRSPHNAEKSEINPDSAKGLDFYCVAIGDLVGKFMQIRHIDKGLLLEFW
jgi:hypothetical protein